ncbi:MAG: NAD(P)H dehydrogenase, partial [Ralstonia sp.]|nr:NAD(P)H dehydrogenase [Ralstonia sp.]MBA4297523.1 NAD(P)H dehydrogenase [Ralstonia sp.]
VLHDADDASADVIDAHIAQVRAALQPWLPTDADAVA